MYKKITWSPLSVNDFEIVLEYLHENWNEQVVYNFNCLIIILIT